MFKFFLGIVCGLLIAALVPWTYFATGSFDATATSEPTFFEAEIAPWARDRSISRRAPVATNPFAGDPAAVATGLNHYRANCAVCHGAPEVEAGELAQGLAPSPPLLDAAATQERPDGELYWIVEQGIRMTGMPAFGPTHGEEEIWKIVAFLRHLPEITAEEQEALRAALAPEGDHHHDGEEEEEAPAPPGEHRHDDGGEHQH